MLNTEITRWCFLAISSAMLNKKERKKEKEKKFELAKALVAWKLVVKIAKDLSQAGDCLHMAKCKGRKEMFYLMVHSIHLWVVGSILHGGHIGLFLVPASAPRLV